MARPLRIEFPDAIYHVTSRGNERREIVRDDRDREAWLARLQRVATQSDWRVFAFALMDNHYHLFLQTPRPNLSSGMQILNTSCAGYFNARHQRSGHLFQGRFHAVLVQDEGHWLELSRYVHLNPVRARLVRRPEHWRWSTCRGYLRPSRRLDWVDYDRVLSEFGKDPSASQRAYRAYLAEGLLTAPVSPLAAAVHQLVLGSETFVEKIRALVRKRPRDADLPQLLRLQDDSRPDLDRIRLAVAHAFDVDPASWTPGRRSDHIARAVAAYVCRNTTTHSARAIARALGYRTGHAVGVACRRVERALADRRFKKRLLNLIKQLNSHPT